MQLTATTPTPALATAPTAPRSAGAPATTPTPANRVATVDISFPTNFGGVGTQDVWIGTRHSTHASLDDATWAARAVAAGRASIGIVAEQGQFTVADLLTYDNDQVDPDPRLDRPTELILGSDPFRSRTVVAINQLHRPGSPVAPVLHGVWIKGGNTLVSFNSDGGADTPFGRDTSQ